MLLIRGVSRGVSGVPSGKVFLRRRETCISFKMGFKVMKIRDIMRDRRLFAAAWAGFFFVAVQQQGWGARAVLAQDTYTCSIPSLSRTVMGQSSGLCIDGRSFSRKRAWLQFDLPAALPPNVTWANVVRATLSVYVNQVYTGGVLEVYGVKQPWSESSLTEVNAPAVVANPDTGRAYANTRITSSAKWVSFEVTELVRDWVEGVVVNNGLVIAAADGSAVALLQSKEMNAGAHAELEILTEPKSALGAPGPAGPQGPQGPTGASGRDGKQGPMGLSGLTGRDGPRGEPGLQGPRGDVGPAGERGPVGAQGIPGAPGVPVLRLLPRGDIAMGEFTQGEKP